MTVIPYPTEFIDPPHVLETETALLGAILWNADALDRVRGIVEPTDFIEPFHAQIFEAMCERRDRGETIDRHLVTLVLGDQDLGGVTVSEYLARLQGAATTIINAPDYAREIRHAAMMRRVLFAARDAVVAMSSGRVNDPSSYAASMIEELDDIASAAKASNVRRVSLGEASRSVLAHIEAVRNGKVEAGAPFGLPRLDKATLGMAPGDLIILAGRPGMGKTTMGVHVALSSARRGHGALFVSLEMTAQQLAERALSAAAYSKREEPITYRMIREAKDLSPEAIWRLEQATDYLEGLPLVIEQQPGLNVSQIAARARQVRTRFEREGKKLSLLIVDHIGLVSPSKRYSGNRTQEITEITGALKALAKELGVAILALSQLSREAEKRTDKRPVLSDLRDSGSIEQDADMVIGLYREAYYLEHKENKTFEEKALLNEIRDHLEVEVLKQRQGPTLRIKCFCDIACNVISELEERQQ